MIGDFGTNDKCNTNETAVAVMVNGWNPAFIITVGDNIYYGINNMRQNSCSHEHVNTYDSTIAKHYGNYYTGNIITNRFFPSIGDHEIVGEIDLDPRPGFYLAYYKEYFALPGNERYYTFQKGNIRFICLNNDFGGSRSWTGGGQYPDTTVWEPDGIDSNSVQAHWCKSILDTSTARWNIVYQHKPVHFSWVDEQLDIYKTVRWPFKSWGADIVLSGDIHWYERVRHKNMTYIINGLGGGKFDPIFEDTIPHFVWHQGSKFHYNDTLGAQLVDEYNDSLVFKFINVNGQVIDRYVLLQPKTIKIRTLMEGTYNKSNGRSVPDTVKVYLRRSASPFAKIDSAVSKTDSLGYGLYTFKNAKYDSSYYIAVTHRNTIETWSKFPVKFDDEILYDFTTDSGKAYGNNMIRKGSEWCIYSGDVSRDGIVDGSDFSRVFNDLLTFTSGYVSSDIDGNGLVDATDLLYVNNNVFRYTITILPISVSPIWPLLP